jgi:hypothetical protein
VLSSMFISAGGSAAVVILSVQRALNNSGIRVGFNKRHER